MAEKNKKDLNQEMFTNKDGYVEGGIEIETTNPAETQDAEVQGQGKILKEKKRTCKNLDIDIYKKKKKIALFN